MPLRFRRHFFSRFVLLSFAILHLEQQSLLGMQEPGSESKPNSLRIGAPKGSAKTPTASGFERPSPVAEPIKESTAKALETASLEEMELALSIATASLSHASPFLWLMAGPTSNLFVDRSIETDLLDEDVAVVAMLDDPTDDNALSEPSDPLQTDQMSSNLAASTLPVVDLYEPPRLIPAIETGFRNLEMQEGDPIEAEESPKTGSKEMAKPTSIGRPSNRPVRIPFENKDEEPEPEPDIARAIPTREPLNRDRDSQRDQEEPKLDPRANGNEKDQQGVDALRASKPRRVIRIDDPKNEGIPIAPIVQSKPTDPLLAKRLQRAESCLSYYLDNPESTSVRSPWAVMHALLAFGGEYELVHGQGKVNAIGWMCHNGTCRTQRIFTPTNKGFTPNVGDGVQGHEGQFMAILAQSNVPLNYPIQIGSSKFTVEDLVRHEMMTCKEKSELTFKLIGLSYYLDSNKQWRANDGKIWSISKLIQEELAQPIVGAACGGVHRLMGFSFSVKQRQLQGQPVNGQFARASKFVKEYVDYTWQLQNPDGSFSTNWYEGRANEPNDERKVQTTGHMLEWLMYTLTDEELSNPRVGRSIDFLLSKIYDKREQKWPIGPRGHATRAVGLYQARTRETQSKPNSNFPINSAAKSGVSAGATRK